MTDEDRDKLRFKLSDHSIKHIIKRYRPGWADGASPQPSAMGKGNREAGDLDG